MCSPMSVEYGSSTYAPTYREYTLDGTYYEFGEQAKPLTIKKGGYGDYTVTVTRDHPYFNLDILRYQILSEIEEYSEDIINLIDNTVTKILNRRIN